MKLHLYITLVSIFTLTSCSEQKPQHAPDNKINFKPLQSDSVAQLPKTITKYRQDPRIDLYENLLQELGPDVKTYRLNALSSDTTCPQRTVELYFNNSQVKSEHPYPHPDYIIPIKYQLPDNDKLIENTIRALLLYQLNDQEKKQGFNGEFSLKFRFKSMHLKDGVLTLSFHDEFGWSHGGSARATQYRTQLERTALQFARVDTVIYDGTYFQP